MDIDDSAGGDGSSGSRRPATYAAGVPPSRLSRDLIVATAIAMADRDGVSALTMRGLGHRLGVEAMSLYRYVNGREDLLEGMTSRLIAQLRSDPGRPAGPVDGWQSYLQRFAHGVRDVAIAHPLIFPLIATRHPGAGWLRPPLRSVAIVENFLNALTARGLTDVQAVRVYRSFSSFLLGHLLLETASLGGPTTPAEEPLNEGDADVPTPETDQDLTDYPTVQRLRTTLSEDHTAAEFEQGLEALLDRLNLQLAR